MDDKTLARYAGACAVLGGSAWVAACALHASQPSGCVGDGCELAPMRDATSMTSLLFAASGVLLLLSGAGLVALIRRRGRLAWPGVLGSAASVGGAAVLILAVALQELLFTGDFALMPALVLPGIVLLALGSALLAWNISRSRVLPRWSATGLLLGAVLLPGANEQTAAVLLAVPFGVAWIATGAAVVVRSRQPAQPQRTGDPSPSPASSRASSVSDEDESSGSAAKPG